MTNQELNNYLSNKQCCLENLTSEALDKLKIGSSDSRCKQKEVIFGNILFEILNCTTVNRDQFNASINPITSVPDGYTATIYINDIQVSDTLTIFSPNFTDYLVNNINNYSSSLDVNVDISSSPSIVTLNSNIVNGDYEAYGITNYPVANTRVDVTITNVETNGNTCLTEEDVCLMTPYLNKICESC